MCLKALNLSKAAWSVSKQFNPNYIFLPLFIEVFTITLRRDFKNQIIPRSVNPIYVEEIGFPRRGWFSCFSEIPGNSVGRAASPGHAAGKLQEISAGR